MIINLFYRKFSIAVLIIMGAGLNTNSVNAQSNNVDEKKIEPISQRYAGLRDLILIVLENQPELSQAEAESRLANARVKEARSNAFPQFSVNGSYAAERQKLYEANRTNNYENQFQGQFRLTLPLVDPSINANLRKNKANSLAVDWQLVSTREQLMLRTVELYIEILKNQQLTELARNNLSLHREYVSQMKEIARKDLGRASDLPVAQARVALAESVLTSRLAKLEVARLQWRNHSGMTSPDLTYIGNINFLIKDLGEVPLPETLEMAISESIENSPQLQKSLSDLKSSWHSYELSKTATKPKINAEAQTKTGQNYGYINGRQDNISIGINLQWMLPFNPGYKYGNRAAREAINASESAVDSTIYRIRAAVEAQWYEMLANQNSLISFEEYVISSETVVKSYSEQFKIGRRSLLDVLNAENEAFTAKTNYVSVQTDLTLSSWRLLGLRGLLPQELGI
mgnify:CR=1 FL=1